jgi:hypothetical protein
VALPALSGPASRWSWAVGPWTGLPTRQLARATQRSCKLRLTGTSEVTFTLDGTADEATKVQELVSDLWVMRDGFTLYRGRVGGTTDTLDGTKHTVAVTTGDYRALLARRLLYDADTLTYTNTDPAAIAAGLISTTQAKPGGGLNITDGSTPIGASRTITYPAGQSVGQAIEQLSQMDGGWNWDIVPTTGQVGQVFTTWLSRGQARGKVLDYPGRVASLTRTVDPGSYANSIRETGNTGIAAALVAAADIATRPEGRWDAQLGDTSLLDAASVASRAAYDLAQRQTIVPAYQVKLYPGSWGGPMDIWLGDIVELRVLSGRLQVDDFLRVWEVDIDLDDADNETVTLTLSDLDPFKRARSRQVEFRLQSLERR